MTSDAIDFYASLPVFDNFAEAVKAKNYRPLPDDWVIGFSDVVGSTQAIANGRYKAVNMVGAGVIARTAPVSVHLRRRRRELCRFALRSAGRRSGAGRDGGLRARRIRA